MKIKIAIYGAGGFGKEVHAMLEMDSRFEFAGFIDDFKDNLNPIKKNDVDQVLIAVANPSDRKNIYSSNKVAFQFGSFIHRELELHKSIKIGKGCIICAGVKCTVDITIGDFVIINLNSVIGHDVQIGNYCSIMPSVNIAGNVELSDGVFVGTGAMILQGVKIGSNAIIGAGSLVTKDVESNATVIGVPARKLIK